MAQYSTNFGEYTTGAAPGDWTQRWGNYATKFVIEADGSLGGKILALDGTADSAASWNDIDSDSDRDDVEVLGKFRAADLTSSTDPNVAVLVRGASGRDGYYAGIVGTTTVRLRRVVSNTEATVTSQTGRSFATNTWYWIRLQVIGTAIKVRVWADGASEPGTWDIDTTDSNVTAAGWVGVYSNGLATEADWDYFAVGTNGDAAPGPSSDSTAPVLSSPSGTGGALTCSGSVTTDEGNGTLYAVVTASSTAPSAAQVKAGQDHTGAAALRVVSQAVSATGAQAIGSGSVTAGTRYWHFMHEDAAANQSTVASSASFVVTASGPTIDTQPSNQTVTAPATATFSVAATTSGGALSYQWQREPAAGGGFGSISGETSSSYTTGATTVSGGGHNNGDKYRCQVTDSNGTTTSSQATLTVNAAVPVLTSSPLKDNTGTLHLAAPFEAFVLNSTTGALVLRKQSLTSHASTGVVTFSDAAMAAATQYRVVWRRTDTGAQGVELLTTA